MAAGLAVLVLPGLAAGPAGPGWLHHCRSTPASDRALLWAEHLLATVTTNMTQTVTGPTTFSRGHLQPRSDMGEPKEEIGWRDHGNLVRRQSVKSDQLLTDHVSVYFR